MSHDHTGHPSLPKKIPSRYSDASELVQSIQGWCERNEVAQQVQSCVMSLSNTLEIKPFWLVIGTAGLLLVYCGVLDRLITHCIGFFYPAWMSFKAIEKGGGEGQKDRLWLCYWVVFATFSFLEIFGDIILFWIPMYYVIKILFLLWLFLPNYQGAEIVYTRVIRPILLQNEALIDSWISKLMGGDRAHAQ